MDDIIFNISHNLLNFLFQKDFATSLELEYPHLMSIIQSFHDIVIHLN